MSTPSSDDQPTTVLPQTGEEPTVTAAPATRRARLWERRVPARIGRARTSTVVIGALFVLLFGLDAGLPQDPYVTVPLPNGDTVRVRSSQLSTAPASPSTTPPATTSEAPASTSTDETPSSTTEAPSSTEPDDTSTTPEETSGETSEETSEETTTQAPATTSEAPATTSDAPAPSPSVESAPEPVAPEPVAPEPEPEPVAPTS
jgi:hypothetical protein